MQGRPPEELIATGDCHTMESFAVSPLHALHNDIIRDLGTDDRLETPLPAIARRAQVS